MLQDTCEDMILKNTSVWEMSSSTEGLAPPKSVKNALCPRLCNDRGRCINGTCKCRRGMPEFLRCLHVSTLRVKMILRILNPLHLLSLCKSRFIY